MPSILSKVWSGIKTAGSVAGKVIKKVVTNEPVSVSKKPTTSFVFPIDVGVSRGVKSTVSVAKKVPTLATKGYQAITNIFKSDAKRLSGVVSKPLTVGKAILGGAATGAGTAIAFQTAESAVSGNPVDAGDIVRSGAVGASFGVNKIGAALGAGTGLAENFYNAMYGQGQSKIQDATNIYKNVQDKIVDMPNINTSPNIINIPSTDFTPLTKAVEGLTKTLPSSPISTYVDVSSPQPSSLGGFSVNMPSSGFAENLPLMLLLLAGGAGVGGYMYGRKRRKKKYKKRRRR